LRQYEPFIEGTISSHFCIQGWVISSLMENRMVLRI
jgi:hypothetical protein